MLGYSIAAQGRIKTAMLTTSQTLYGHEVTEVLGIVEGVAEGSFPILSIEHLSIEKGGGLSELIEKAKYQITREAFDMGATAVVGFRYEVIGRHTEKSVLAYGTAVKCKRL